MADDPLIGQTLAGRYRVEALLGSGGMGSVYRAEHVLMRKMVAIKVLHPEMTALEEVVKRFEREAMAAGRIDHPNVAPASDFGRLEDGSFYLVLEYVAGKTLKEALETEGAFPVERTLFVARQIASALGAAHAAGVVHRDLKPENIMLIERSGTADFVKVLDFGIAKVASESGGTSAQLTRIGSIFGTPQYMAPEQAAGKPVDHRVDLYAVGLMMHEMLVGRPTFDSPEVIALLAMQMTEPPPPLPSHVPEEVAGLVLQLLEKEPDKRIAAAAELVARLDLLLGPAAQIFDSSVLGFAPSRSAMQSVALQTAARPRAPSVSGAARTGLRSERLTALLLAARKRIPSHVVVKGRYIPSWALFSAGILLAILLLFLPERSPDKAEKDGAEAPEPAASGSPEATEDDEGEEEISPTQRLDPELERVIIAARRGQPEALYALQLRKESDRTAREWLAMAVGRLKRREIEPSLEAFARAVEMTPSAASDGTMLAGLRFLADKEAHAKRVLRFAAEHLGPHGADLLFHAWSSTSRVTVTTQTAKELLDSATVRASMSEALKLALLLRDAKDCEQFRGLLPRVEAAADERSVRPLKELLQTDGCGEDKKSDCYPCLRGDTKLKDALTQAALRKQPRYELPRRFRFR